MKLVIALMASLVAFSATARDSGEGAQSPLVCMNRAAFVGQVIASRKADWPEQTVIDRVTSIMEKAAASMGVSDEDLGLMLQEIHNIYSHPDYDYDTLMRSFLRRCSGAVEA